VLSAAAANGSDPVGLGLMRTLSSVRAYVQHHCWTCVALSVRDGDYYYKIVTAFLTAEEGSSNVIFGRAVAANFISF
jgi:hypothetical protein